MWQLIKHCYGLLRSHDSLIFPLWLVLQCLWRRKRAIVVRRIEALGDVVCTLPLCYYFKKQHPDCFVALITNIYTSKIARLSSQIDCVCGVSSSAFRVHPWLHVFIAKIYIPKTQDETSPRGTNLHLIDDLAASCGINLADRQPRLVVPPILKNKIATKVNVQPGKTLFTINPGPTWAVRNWPAVSWQALINLIHEQYQAQIVMIGGPTRGRLTDYTYLNGVHKMAGGLRSDELAALISVSDLLVSIDSGPIHIAGAVGTPIVGLFGAVNPELRFSSAAKGIALTADVPCLFCHHQSPLGHWQTGCPHEIRCMQELKPEKVFHAVRQVLSAKMSLPRN